jgi:hypothetical protein
MELELNRLMRGEFEVGDFVATGSQGTRVGTIEAIGSIGNREGYLVKVWCGQAFCTRADLVDALEADPQVLMSSVAFAMERRAA